MRTTLLFFSSCFALISAAAADSTITHGPMLGGLTETSVRVWGRSAAPGAFRVRYGLAADKLETISERVETSLAHDNTGWIELKGLKPDTRYYYELTGADAPDGAAAPERSGTFRTLPLSQDFRDAKLNPRGLFNFRFEYGSCANQNPDQGAGYGLPLYKTMNDRIQDQVYFTIHNGDWLYEEVRTYTPGEWLRQVGATAEQMPPVVSAAPTLVGVWENYKLYLDRGKNLAAWHRNVPAFFTCDDHEILNDVWGTATAGLRDRRAVFRDIGMQAWHDYLAWANPVEWRQPIFFGRVRLTGGSDVLEDPQADFSRLNLAEAGTLHVHWGGPTAGVNDNALDAIDGDPNAGVYQIVEVVGKDRLRIHPAPKQDGEVSYSIGRLSHYKFKVGNCEFFALDTKAHRDMHDTRQPDKPGISMIGARQREWLLKNMAASDADFLFVISTVTFMIPHVGGGAVRTENKDDAWTAFIDEREKLFDAWDKLGKPVFLLTGDLHNSMAIKITDNIWEFVSGPHNSQNHWYSDEGNRPATGKFKYGPRECDLRWSTWFSNDIPREELRHPFYCVVQINNVFNNPIKLGETRWIAFERPQAIFQYFDGRTGELRYAEAVTAAPREK
ncbi:MAG: alkaline phosphatase D family protein [Planctomycetes bacterium]|nr:alkaline phosphatase D family protein [Planctomycetota bacterium]